MPLALLRAAAEQPGSDLRDVDSAINDALIGVHEFVTDSCEEVEDFSGRELLVSGLYIVGVAASISLLALLGGG